MSSPRVVAAAAGADRTLLTGGTTLALAMVVANVGNYTLNLVLARLLTPADFSDANLMVTLMLTLTAIALGLQLVAARFVGQNDAAGEHDAADRIAQRLRRWALGAGAVTGLLLAAPAASWQGTFHTASPWPFVILGLGMPCYLVQSVGRGVMQGRLQFRPLAVTFVVEMVARVGLGILLVAVGAGVEGATAALTASFVATFLSVRVLGGHRRAPQGAEPDLAALRAYAVPVSVLLLGQIIANNSDVLVAKGFLPPTEAGVYSAVALVGRAVFFLSWSVATVVFPAVARRHASGDETRSLLRGGVLAVLGIGLACTIGALVVGGPVLGVVLGPTYGGLSVRLASYAAMTTLFAVANLVASHDLSRGRHRSSWLLVGGSVLQVGLLLLWHAGIGELIAAQCVAMATLVGALCVPSILHDRIRGSRPGTREAVVR